MIALMVKTYSIRLGCENCLRLGIYQIPYGMEFINYEHGAEWEEETESGYGYANHDEYNFLRCQNCGTPRLRVTYWEIPVMIQPPQPPQPPEPPKDGSRASDHPS